MENASKALIIAGSVLLAILLVSLGIGIMNGASTDSDMTEEQVTAFNGEWSSYLEKKMNGRQIKDLIQKVYESNVDETESGEGRTIQILLGTSTEGEPLNGSGISAVKAKIVNGNSYTTTGTYSDEKNGLLTAIRITGTFATDSK